MRIGFIGLGKMGKEMVLQMLEKSIEVVVYNRSREKTEELKSEIRNPKSELNPKSQIPNPSNQQLIGKLTSTYSIFELVSKLESPRIIWIMVEHGKPVDEVIDSLISSGIEKEDIIIDGGNSYYRDSVLRYKELKKKGIHYLDIGTSGGLEGARYGACVMVGGEEKIFHVVKPVLEKISVPGGVAYFGPSGAGHFVKMVHNGIEYGMLQAIGEGFEILEKSPYKLDLHQIAFNYTRGSVVRGWLMELLERALKINPKSEIRNPNKYPKSKYQMTNQIQNPKSKILNQQLTTNNQQPDWLGEYDGKVGGGSTGEWTVKTAYELGVDVPVIAKSLLARKKSQEKPTFAGKVVAALRNQFGGHKD